MTRRDPLGDVSCDRAVWEWLPARTDARRVTLPSTASATLGLPASEIAEALARMERTGNVVRNSAIGRQTGWHRGKPLPPAPELAEIVEDDWTLY